MKTILRLTAILALLAGVCSAQIIIQTQNAGVTNGTFKKYFVLNCVSGLTCSVSGSTLSITGGGTTPLLAGNGTATAPSIAFSSFPGSGLYLGAALNNPMITATGNSGAGVGVTSSGFFFIGLPGGYFNAAMNLASTPTLFRVNSQDGFGWTASGGDASAAADTGLSRSAAGIVSVDTSTIGNAAGLLRSGNKVFVTADFTDANSGALQAITGLTYALGTVVQQFSFHCSLMYSQATPSAGDQFGIGVITTAPTSVSATGVAYTNTGAAPAPSNGVLTALASTTPTAVVTFTPAVTTILRADLDGTVETAGTTASTLNFYVLNGTAANVIVVRRGSYCALY